MAQSSIFFLGTRALLALQKQYWAINACRREPTTSEVTGTDLTHCATLTDLKLKIMMMAKEIEGLCPTITTGTAQLKIIVAIGLYFTSEKCMLYLMDIDLLFQGFQTTIYLLGLHHVC